MIKNLERCLEKVAAFIHKESLSFDHRKIELKQLNNLVSYVDKEAEKMLVEGLSQLVPEANFETEEETVIQRKDGLRWIIDPLDGTTNFSHGIPTFSISVALAEGNDLLTAGVYEVNQKEFFSAEKGKGAFLNGDRIHVAGNDQLAKSLIATGFPYYEFEGLDSYIEILKKFMQSTRGVRRLGSAATDLCYTACGRFDGFFEFNLNSYDVAGGILIVKEAGGLVSDFSGIEGRFDGVETLAAGGVYAEMLKVINSFWKN